MLKFNLTGTVSEDRGIWDEGIMSSSVHPANNGHIMHIENINFLIIRILFIHEII
ncbi:hypothetical protein M113_3388 [Bacteroides fragilis str. 3986 N3]|uniref:Uncharacterized protein n=2 Tax=Bacteroides fragilis TaxID=817 RepID=A0AAN4MVW9_BACFG|nr:hypothetical protein M101_3336 [Bacteroides fragilis str. 1007-1-F \